jgi:hypothetical protein
MLLMNVSLYLAKHVYVTYKDVCVHAITSRDNCFEACTVDFKKISILRNNVNL